jgi:translocation and assembly module TamB
MRALRILARIAVALAIVAAATVLAAILVLRSGWFQERVRERIIAEIEHSTGARAELGSFRFDWETLTATVAPLVIHGSEHAGEPPLLKADSVALRLRVISIVERKIDLAMLRVDRPAVRIVFYPDGSNNLPHRSETAWTEDLLNLAVLRYEVNDGVLDYDSHRLPLNLRGERLRAAMAYDPHGPRYRGELSSRARVIAGRVPPLEVEISAAFAFEKSRIEITRLRVDAGNSHAELTGTLSDPRAPRGKLALKAAFAVKDAVRIFGAPVAPVGNGSFDGALSIAFTDPLEFEIAGRLNAAGLGYTNGRLNLTGAALRADVRMGIHDVAFNNLALTAAGANVSGAATLADWRRLHFDGKFSGVDLQQAAHIAAGRSVPWNATLAGDFAVDAVLGEPSAKLQSEIAITPQPGGQQIEGQIDVLYDQAAGTVRLNDSHIATAATRVEAAGTLGQSIELRMQSSNLDDFLPALALASENAPKEIPLKLANGSVSFRGTVTGSLENPAATGHVSISNAAYEGHAFDHFTGDIQATRDVIHVDRASIARGATVVEGSGTLDHDAIQAQLTVRGAELAPLLKEAGSSIELSGTAAGTAHISGTIHRPEAQIEAEINHPAGFGESLDHLRATVLYSPEQIQVTSADADEGGATAHLQGDFRHAANDWQNGEIHFEASSPGIRLTQIKSLAKLQPSLAATVSGSANGSARLAKGALSLTAIQGSLAARGVAWDRQPLGDITATAETRGADLSVHASAQMRDLKLDAQGRWKLEGDDPGSAILHVAHATVASLNSVIMAGGPLEKTEIPFEGSIDGANATVGIALAKPQDFQALLTIPTFEVHPKPTQTLRLGVQAPDLVLQNAAPIVVAVSSKEARVRSASFRARDTNLEATGAVSFDAANTSDLAVRGSVNLIILQLLNPDLVANGIATVQTTIRGSLKDPQLNGRMELRNTSLYLGDLPNGVDNANGAVVFDRNRATIESLTAQTGGGTVSFSGFLGFGNPLVYRLQATATKVRVRYPEDVSATFNSTLALNGTSDSSTVSGTITLTRASFTPRADLAQLLAQAARPVPTPATPSDYLRGMQFDVRIQSDPNFELQTSLARNLQSTLDLRLRGTPLRPALLGTISVNEGEVEVFGNRYTVNRCDIQFLNPVRIDPILDMNLETKARGIAVNIALSGTMEKLNVNYSSDPPLQPREIIALLAVGRAPDTSSLNPETSNTGSTSLAEAGGGLISEAITEQLSNRFQRFFGSSHVRIDPTVTGVEYLPQALLTFEQQVSKDITLTYITNLNRTQEQIVQIEWDFSKRWSAVAVREANGLFGIDFQWRKRFK